LPAPRGSVPPVASEFFIETQSPVTPRLRIGYRVSVGARCVARRSGPGLIGIEIRRGDGGDPETYPAVVDFLLYGPVLSTEEVTLKLGAIDMVGTGSYPRTYQLRVMAIGGVDDIFVSDPNLATSPYSQPGIQA
jgi:hypothetical protein